MATVFLRTIIIYIVLVVAMRLMGKRQVGELEISELVITFLLSELAVIPIANKNAPLSHAIVPVLLLLSAEVIFSFCISKSSAFRKLIIGKPSIIIRKGNLDQKELLKLRMSVAELMSELRLKGVASLSEVDYAIVEDNGKLSVFKTESSSPVTPEILKIPAVKNGIAHCVALEGKAFDAGLAEAGKSREWLMNILAEKRTAIDDICIMTVDDGGKIFIIMKEK